MIEYYAHIKLVHVAAAITSGILFAARGTLLLKGTSRAMSAPVRYLSYAIDTVLLIAGLALAFSLPSALFSNGWLAVKIALLPVYIVLGSFALKRARTRRVRMLCFVAALLVFVAIYGIARSHDPLGFIAPYWPGSG